MTASQAIGSYRNADALSLYESLAKLTWGWLEDARQLGLGFSEDTISDLAMLEIGRSVADKVGVFRVSKRDERLVGFDWLWVILRSGTYPTFYVVQAKKLKLDSPTYSYGRLKYKAGSRYQIDALEDFANWLGAVPLYCFYNNVDDCTARKHWNCRVQQAADPPQLGCTVVPLEVIRPVHDRTGSKRFDSIHWHPDAVPWRCLFHPSCTRVGLDSVSSAVRDRSKSTGRIRGLEFLPSLTPRRIRQAGDDRLFDDDGDNSGANTVGDDHLLDMGDLVRQLNLEDLVARYITQQFIPVPERILTLSIND